MSTDEEIDSASRADADGWRRRVDLTAEPAGFRAPDVTTRQSASRTDRQRKHRTSIAALLAGGTAAAAVVVVGFFVQNRWDSADVPLSVGSTDAMVPNASRFLDAAPLVQLLPVASVPEGAVSMPWALTSAVSAAQIEVGYAQGDGSCVRPLGVHVEESVDAVTIEVLSANDGGGTCPSRLLVARSLVTLHDPLGGRELLHAASDESFTSSFNTFTGG